MRMSGPHWHLSARSSARWLIQVWSFAGPVTHPCVPFGFGGARLTLPRWVTADPPPFRSQCDSEGQVCPHSPALPVRSPGHGVSGRCLREDRSAWEGGLWVALASEGGGQT